MFQKVRLSAFACCLHSIGMWNTRSLSFTISLGADSLLEISLHPSPRSKSSTARFLVSTSCLHLRSVRMKNLTKNLTEVFSDKLNRFSEGDCRIRMLAGFTVPVRCRWCRRPRVRGRGGGRGCLCPGGAGGTRGYTTAYRLTWGYMSPVEFGKAGLSLWELFN